MYSTLNSKNEMKTNHLLDRGFEKPSSHFNMHQKTKAVNKDDIAYTSPSTAENQNESEKV